MTTTSHPEFSVKTEALEVAKAFPEGIRGKTVIITGVNRSGVGFTTAEAFASQSPSHLIFAGRTPAKIQESIDALKVKFPDVDYRALQMDLSSQKSVRTAAAEVLSWADIPTVNIIVNSAGVMAIPERTLTEDGIEMHFGTNHIGHFLFTSLIMPKLIQAAQDSPKGATRVVNVSSLSPIMAAGGIRWSDINFDVKSKDLPKDEQPNYQVHTFWGGSDLENKSYLPLEGYNQSKVANLLFSVAANQRLYHKHGILSLTVHPGILQTELGRSQPDEIKQAIAGMVKAGAVNYQTQGSGAATSLVAAVDPKLTVPDTTGGSENHGVYLVDCQISDKAHPLTVSSEEAEKLWKLSEELVKEKFSW